MSNEELAVLIQTGETERIPELWDQVTGLIKWKANRTMTVLELRGNPCGVTFDDLCQSGYIALIEAVRRYNPDNGVAFSTCLINSLKTVFAQATGHRTKSGQNEPLNNSLSLDKTVDDEADGSPFSESVPDPKATAQIQLVEESLWRDQLREALEEALSSIPEKNADVLRMRYYQGLTLAEVGKSKDCSPEMVRQIEQNGLKLLRRPRYACELFPFYQHDFYRHTGLNAFRQSGMSVQERYLMAVDEHQARASLRKKQQEERIHKELAETALV